MKKKISIILVLLICLFSLTGCYDASSIEDAYYVVALGIDSTENDTYNISIQIAKNKDNSSSSGSSQSSDYNIYTVEADTAFFLIPLHFYIQSPFHPGTLPTMFHPQKPLCGPVFST